MALVVMVTHAPPTLQRSVGTRGSEDHASDEVNPRFHIKVGARRLNSVRLSESVDAARDPGVLEARDVSPTWMHGDPQRVWRTGDRRPFPSAEFGFAWAPRGTAGDNKTLDVATSGNEHRGALAAERL
ncbi:MAG: hypothetical protein Q7R41_04215 [Phycisphaerales bacterium]|nr:hypothetical protein [Phycisphaerales bacterium]